MKKIYELYAKFMAIHCVLPFGNEGRGIKIYLWPFVAVAGFAIVAPLIDKFIVG